MEQHTITAELKDFIRQIQFDIDAIETAANKGERSKSYIIEKYGNIERTAQRFKKRLSNNATALNLLS